MTIIFGIVRDEYAILGADTRITYLPETEPSYYNDNAVKLAMFNGGWVAGAGSAAFIDNFNEITSSRLIVGVDDIDRMFIDMLNGNGHLNTTNANDHLLDNTQIAYLFTYANDQGHPDMHIETLHCILGRRGLSGKNKFFSFGHSEDQVSIVNSYQSKINHEQNFVTTLKNCAAFVEDISLVNQSVSPFCDIGILIKESNEQVGFLRIREHSSTIINDNNPLEFAHNVYRLTK
ncbi:hypothetical protein V1499_09950 [Neobacillus sp. SCS-31]|uniref:hypothetical protein n=1 Tax=Neobacillus oceani TaxID=3115292 RepID=UPI00390689F9